MEIYLKLLGTVLVQVVLSVLLNYIKNKTKFGKIPNWVQQLIIGVIFGGAAVFGTEFGVNIDGAVINTRDAAPLCAGLLFGAPAGIIAGVIGGIERWFAVYWGAGMYSRLACSVSTILAGLFAAVLRKYMFDDKRPTPAFGAVVAIVMEVLHLFILFITHISNASEAYEIVKTCTLPMVACNALSVMLATFLLYLFTNDRKKDGKKTLRSISQRVQSWMLICVVIAYLFTTLFVFVLQTNTAITDIENLMTETISDVQADIYGKTDGNLIEITKNVAVDLEKLPNTSLSVLALFFDVNEINKVSKEGIITDSTIPEYIGFDMNSGDQSREFMVLTEGRQSFVQDYQEITYDSSVKRKYVGYAMKDGGFLQVGFDYDGYQDEVSKWVFNVTENRHLGSTGFIVVANRYKTIVSTRSDKNEKRLSQLGIEITESSEQYKRYSVMYNGEEYYWMYAFSNDYYIITMYSAAEVFASRDNSTYINSFMEVIVFAALFALIYFLIKKLVVKNIRSVNKNLEQIIGGNLLVTVNVRSSTEFSSLSDDINTTVETLKAYIDEAAARIDKELEFAKNIQLSSLPSKFPAFPNVKEFDIYATMNTAKEVGGDFYDLYMLDDNTAAFLIADVSGKGIPAAMFMMRAKTMIRNFAEERIPVNEIFTRSNEKLCEGNDAGMFVTAWMGIMDIRTGVIKFANAGHNPPVVYRKHEGYQYLKSKVGFVLAGMEGVRYKEQELTLYPGDKLYLYTDGITEATDSNNELYGEDRLQAFLNTSVSLSAKDVLLGVKEDIDKFVGEAEQFDDMTMLMVDYFGRKEQTLNEKVFPAKIEVLDDVTGFVNEVLENADCGMKTAMVMAVAVEEIFVNVAHYAYKGTEAGSGDVLVGAGVEDNIITVRFSDSGVPFDPLAKQDPDVTASADERKIGGLGIFMVKKTMDDMRYEYKDGHNILTIKKKVGK